MVTDAAVPRSSVRGQRAPHFTAFCAFSGNCHRILQHYAHLFRGSGRGFASTPSGQRYHAHDFHIQRFFHRHSRRSRAKQVRNITICIPPSAFETCISLFNWLLSGASFLILILLLLFYQNQDRRSQLDS